jgi:hypothetical protein
MQGHDLKIGPGNEEGKDVVWNVGLGSYRALLRKMA